MESDDFLFGLVLGIAIAVVLFVGTIYGFLSFDFSQRRSRNVTPDSLLYLLD
jgi:hypothetical protein